MAPHDLDLILLTLAMDGRDAVVISSSQASVRRTFDAARTAVQNDKSLPVKGGSV